MKVHVLNRQAFELMLKNKYGDTLPIEKDINNCFISIHNFDQSMIKATCNNFLNLWFDDIVDDEEYNERYYPNCELFSERQADLIIQFCKKNSDKKNLYVHCFAGISRSGAVGAFVNDYFGEEKGYEFFGRHPWISANPFVSRILNEKMRGEIE